MKLLCFGDSIVSPDGVARQIAGAHYTARVGASFTEIAYGKGWEIPPGYDVIVVSMGTNPGGKTAAQLAEIPAALQRVADKCGMARIVWILPHFVPEAGIVAKLARDRGETAVAFKCTSGFHPDSYDALARDILAALA